MRIVSNGAERDLLHWYDLTFEEREKLLLTISEGNRGSLYDGEFVRFMNKVYNIKAWLSTTDAQFNTDAWDQWYQFPFPIGKGRSGLCLRHESPTRVVVGRWYQEVSNAGT